MKTQSPIASLSPNQVARIGKSLHEISWLSRINPRGVHIDALLSNTRLLRAKRVRLWFLELSDFTFIMSLNLNYIFLHQIAYNAEAFC